MALVSYTGKNLLNIGVQTGEVIRLLPGINEIEDESLRLMKTQSLFQSRISSGVIIILHETLDKDGKRTISEMLKNIPQIFDTKLLKKIIESDGRDKVIEAATVQLEKIKNPAKAKAEEDNNEHFK